MNQNEILKIAAEAGAFWELSETPEKDLAFLMRFAERAAAAERERMESDGIHTCHDECQRPACVAVREAVKAERDRCVLMLERLYERSGEQYKQYLNAAKVLKGEI